LDINNLRGLIATDQLSPYRIDHHTIGELIKSADHGCLLCEVLAKDLRQEFSQSVEHICSCFEVCANGGFRTRSEILWRLDDPYAWVLDPQIDFYYFAVPGRII
jgi:hypothetical protein